MVPLIDTSVPPKAYHSVSTLHSPGTVPRRHPPYSDLLFEYLQENV
jgi:hypothetical protein